MKRIVFVLSVMILLSACDPNPIAPTSSEPEPPYDADTNCVQDCDLAYDTCLLKCETDITKPCECTDALKGCYQGCTPH